MEERAGIQRRWAVTFSVALVVLSYFLFLGKYPLQEPDEARYAEIAREMLESGDFLSPTLDYVDYFEKPPLHYWLTASSMAVLGQNEFALRFWPALLSLLAVGLTGLTGRRLFGPRAGMNAAWVLAGTPIWIAATRLNTIDPVVSSLLSYSLLSFLLFEHSTGRERRLWLVLFYGAAGLATLAKGLIGLLFPFGIVFLHIVITRRFRLLREMRPLPGLVGYLVITAPWFVMVSLKNPGFAWFFFVHEHFLRFLTDTHHRAKPFYYYGLVLVVGLLPFVFGLFQALVRSWQGPGRFLLLWVAVIVVFFSLSSSKMGFYILPVFPALALMVGSYLAKVEEAWKGPGPIPGVHRAGILLCAILSGAALALLPLIKRFSSIPIWPHVLAMASVLLLLALAGRAVVRRRAVPPVFFLWAASTTLTVGLALAAQAIIVLDHSSYPLVKAMEQEVKPDDAIVHLSCYLQGQLFYTGRRPVLVDYEGELAFGMRRIADREDWFWTFDRFFEAWRLGRPMWVFLNERNLDRDFPPAQVKLRETLGDFRIVEGNRDRILLTNILEPRGESEK